MRLTQKKFYDYWMGRAKEATHGQTKARCMAKLKSLYPPELFKNIPHETLVVMGLVCLEAAERSCGIIKTTTIMRKGGHKMNIVELSEFFSDGIAKYNKELQALMPWDDPMVVPPKDWTNIFDGGYIGARARSIPLVRSVSRKYLEAVSQAREGYGPVLKALNAIQKTPWRINKKVFTVMDAAWALGGGDKFGLPEKYDLPMPIPQAGWKEDKLLAQEYAFECQAIRDENKINHGHRQILSRILGTAWMYHDEETIYFPHNLDWRGRIYPVSRYLSPQGSDYSQGLLEFSEGKELETMEAVAWLAIHGTGCFGYDKVPISDRLAWPKMHEEQIRRTVENPLDFTWWTEADSPWLFLAWCYDWAGYLDHGTKHVSHLPVAMDGSCNGLQNYAAMLRDMETAQAVNLAPQDIPNDVYRQVAVAVGKKVHELALSRPEDAELLEQIATQRTRDEMEMDKDGDGTKKETEQLWHVLCAKWIDGKIERAVVKQPVMTYPYNVSLWGIQEQLEVNLGKLIRAGKLDFPYQHRKKCAAMLKNIVHETVREEIVAATRAMDWLKQVAEVISGQGYPISWIAPAGLLVVQEYKKEKSKHLETVIGGIRFRERINQETDEINPDRQVQAIAPNFVHSCDASHLMMTVSACVEEGITNFHMIHDSYGTHAADSVELSQILREQFVELYSGNVLQDLVDGLSLFLPPEALKDVPPPPAQGDFDLKEVMRSKYFFI